MSAVNKPAPPDAGEKAHARWRSARRWWWRVRWASVPVTLIGSALLVLIGFALAYLQAETLYMQSASSFDPPEPAGLLVGTCLAVLIVLELAGIVLAALAAVIIGAGAAAGQGRWFRQRLRLLRRRADIFTWPVVFLRIALALIGGTLVVLATMGLYVDGWIASGLGETAALAVNLPVVVGGIWVGLMLHWLVGPFIQMRYGMAVGALAGTWTRRSGGLRFWIAISAWLGLALAEVLMFLWGAKVIITLLNGGFPQSGNPYSGILAGVLGRWVEWAMLAAFHLLKQIILTLIFERWAVYRLAHRRIEPEYKTFLEILSQAESTSLVG